MCGPCNIDLPCDDHPYIFCNRCGRWFHPECAGWIYNSDNETMVASYDDGVVVRTDTNSQDPWYCLKCWGNVQKATNPPLSYNKCKIEQQCTHHSLYYDPPSDETNPPPNPYFRNASAGKFSTSAPSDESAPNPTSNFYFYTPTDPMCGPCNIDLPCDDHPYIFCNRCGRWFHPECAGWIYNSDNETMVASYDDGVVVRTDTNSQDPWYCLKCWGNVQKATNPPLSYNKCKIEQQCAHHSLYYDPPSDETNQLEHYHRCMRHTLNHVIAHCHN